MAKKTIWCMELLMAIAVSVMAMPNVDLYGSVRLGTWWDKEYNYTDDFNQINVRQDSAGPVYDTVYGKDPRPLNYVDLIPKGAFGMNVLFDRYAFYVEFGVGKDLSDYSVILSNTSGWFYGRRYSQNARVNKLCAEFNFNEHLSILLGQHDVPCNFSISNQGLFGGNGMENCGVLDAGRRPLLQLTGKSKIGDLFSIDAKIAAIVPDTMTTPIRDYRTKDTLVNGQNMVLVTKSWADLHSENYRTSVSIPKLETAIDCRFDTKTINCDVQFAGGYQIFDIVYNNPPYLLNANEINLAKAPLESYVYGASYQVNYGPFFIAATFSEGKNFGTYGVNVGNPFLWHVVGGSNSSVTLNAFYPIGNNCPDSGSMITSDSAGKVKVLLNSFAYQEAVVAKYSPLKSLSLEAGIGMVKTAHEDKQMYSTGMKIAPVTYTWYGQLSYTYAGIITVTPEYGFFNYGKYHYNGTYTYWGFNTSIRIPNVSLK